MNHQNARDPAWLERADVLLGLAVLGGAVTYIVLRQLNQDRVLALLLALAPIGLTLLFLCASSLWMMLRPEPAARPAAPAPDPDSAAEAEESEDTNVA
jgi:hypothetical protein